jgi:phosphoribosyl 1,2-cyclic phosphate phosphodiesterase
MANMKLTFLGTGTSHGVPMIACSCPVCRSEDPRDRRYRCSVLVEGPEGVALVDTTPDFRSQALRIGLRHLDAVLITHAHADHVAGFDDLRVFSPSHPQGLPIYSNAETFRILGNMFEYLFNGENRYDTYLHPQPVVMEGPTDIIGLRVTPLPVRHGKVTTWGYRFDSPRGGSLAYIPDCKEFLGPTPDLLKGVDTLILDGLRPAPHPTHFNIPEALAAIATLGARRNYLTHLTHHVSHAAIEPTLPANVSLAWDGLVLDFP